MSRIRLRLVEWRSATGGAAAVELALVLLLLLLPVLNLVDFAVYAFSRMQVEEAAQMGAQGAWTACNSNNPNRQPATVNCGAQYSSAVTNGIHSTFLTTHVSGSPSEEYDCATIAGGLAQTAVQPPALPPADCSGTPNASSPSAAPGDYVKVAVTYTYAPLFQGISIVSLLNTTVTKTAWTRLK